MLLGKRRRELLEEIRRWDICFLEAATGMGKSTLIPQFVIDDNDSHIVWQLQPRRLAAKRLAQYLTARRAPLADVGYRVRGDVCSDSGTRLLYMTTGYFLHFVLHRLDGLLASTGQWEEDSTSQHHTSGHLSWCTHLFIDEVHELSEETEMVLLLVKILAERGKLPFKVVVLSATLDFPLLHKYFTQPRPPGPPSEDNSQAPPPPPAPPPELTGGDRTPQSISLHLSEGQTTAGFALSPDSLEVAAVTRGSVADGRICAGDLLLQVGDRYTSDMSGQEAMEKLSTRPLDLVFLRRLSPGFAVADQAMNLSERTPFPVKIEYLDDLAQSSAHMDEVARSAQAALHNFSPDRHRRTGPERPLLELCVSLLLCECCPQSDSCALVFLPGLTEIDHLQNLLQQRLREGGRQMSLDIVVLHSVTLAETCEVPAPSSRKGTVYLASSVAETSITLPELTVVVDFGLARGSVYDSSLEMEQLTTRLGSRTSARQRAGRVGRTRPGTVFKLYPRDMEDEMPGSDAVGTGRCLESSILLATKTLVPFLRLDVQHCLQLLLVPPQAKAVQQAVGRLEELDAVTEGRGGKLELTAFGEFAVRLSVLGPRLARLVHAGILFGCARQAVTLAALHASCGRAELLTLPAELRRLARVEEDVGLPAREITVTVGEEETHLGLAFNPNPTKGQRWQIYSIKDGTWAERQDIHEGDELIAVNGKQTAELDENLIVEEIRQRPAELIFRQQPEEEPRPEEQSLWSVRTVCDLVDLAKHVVEMDQGYLSEPVMALNLFRAFLEHQSKSEVTSLHRMRQVDGMVREVSSRLRSLSCSPASSHRKHDMAIFSSLRQDGFFGPRAQPMKSALDSKFLSDCTHPKHLADLRLALCAAFPGNFLFSSFQPVGLEADDVQQPDPAGSKEPTLCLHRVPTELQATDVQAAINKTFGSERVQVEVTEDEGCPSMLGLSAKQCQGSRVDNQGDIASLGETAVMNMLSLRDPKHRLQLLRMDEAGQPQVQACGELCVAPTFEWRLLRFPHLVVKTAPRLTALANIGPIQGLGPPLPQEGPGAEGVRLALAMDLEAVRLSMRQPKTFRGGKAVRSWLVSWLPNADAVDFALLLTFWPREMLLQEQPQEDPGRSSDTVFSSITVGQGLTIHFPPDSPLRMADLKDLQDMHMAMCAAHRTGFSTGDQSRLPTLQALREWGSQHLATASVSLERSTASDKGTSRGLHYSHRRSFGNVLLTQAPSRSLGETGEWREESESEVSDSEDDEVPPWNIECIVVPPPERPQAPEFHAGRPPTDVLRPGDDPEVPAPSVRKSAAQMWLDGPG